MRNQENFYDVIILGSGLGGLIAANQLIQERRKVLLIKEKRFHPSYTREGYRFTPFSNALEKWIPIHFLKKIPFQLDRLGKRGGGESLKQEVSFQIVLPQARIDLYRDRSLLKREWQREFPLEWKKIEDFYQETDRIYSLLNQLKQRESSPVSFPIQSSRSFKQWFFVNSLQMRRMEHWLSPFSSEFKTFLQLQILFKGNLYKGHFPLPLASYLLKNDDRKEKIEPIDFEKITQQMLGRFVKSGGRVDEIDGIDKINIKRREGISLSLKGQGTMVHARLLALSIPIHQCLNLFENNREIISKWAGKISPLYMIIPYFLGIRETGIPVGIKNLLISLRHLDKGYEDGNLLLISLSEIKDESEAPFGKRALTVQALMPFNLSAKKTVESLQNQVMNHLKQLFPFLENHLEFIDRTWAENNLDCWSYPFILYEVNSTYKWRKGVVPIELTKNLFFVGKENFPYLGLEGEIIGGLVLGRKILNHLN